MRLGRRFKRVFLVRDFLRILRRQERQNCQSAAQEADRLSKREVQAKKAASVHRRRVVDVLHAIKSLISELSRMTELMIPSGTPAVQNAASCPEGDGLFADEIASMTDTLSLREIHDLLLGADERARKGRPGGGREPLVVRLKPLLEAMEEATSAAEDEDVMRENWVGGRGASMGGVTSGQRWGEGALLTSLVEEVKREVDSAVEALKAKH